MIMQLLLHIKSFLLDLFGAYFVIALYYIYRLYKLDKNHNILYKIFICRNFIYMIFLPSIEWFINIKIMDDFQNANLV